MDQYNHSHGGHRRRLIEKLKRENLTEHEYLEILLFNAMPRRNTNDLAHRLLSRFGTAYEVFSATEEELLEVEGVGENVALYLRCIGQFYTAYSRKGDNKYCGRYNAERFVSHLKNLRQYPTEEVLDAWLLDENGYILAKHSFEGGIARVIVHPEMLTRLLVEYTPSGLVLAHNHPSGDPTPSDKDEEMTKKCQLLCGSHNVILCDHIIYGKEGVFSYYQSGDLQTISKEYSPDNVLKTLQ